MDQRTSPADGASGTDVLRRPPPDVVVRVPATLDEYRACVELQRLTWGAHFAECVPAAILKVGQRVGGVTAGAFDAAGRLLGFVFGLTGLEHGRLVHWSHMLAVRAEYRDQGLGRRLKAYQREAVLDLGVETVYWTFDPLMARNAHLNLNRLATRVVEYVPEMYGATRSDLHARLGTDRLIVAWPIRAAGVAAALEGSARDGAAHEAAPVLNGADATMELDAVRLPRAVRIEVPHDVLALEAATPGAGMRWRQATRRAFQAAFGRGYRVGGFYRDGSAGRCFYILTRDAQGR